MSIKLDIDYHDHLRSAKPIILPPRTVRPPKGALGAITTFPPITIPPLNTNIEFSILPQYKLSKHPGLAAIDHTALPANFNWRDDGAELSALLTQPGNQMLCGSCWDYNFRIIDYLFKQIK